MGYTKNIPDKHSRCLNEGYNILSGQDYLYLDENLVYHQWSHQSMRPESW